MSVSLSLAVVDIVNTVFPYKSQPRPPRPERFSTHASDRAADGGDEGTATRSIAPLRRDPSWLYPKCYLPPTLSWSPFVDWRTDLPPPLPSTNYPALTKKSDMSPPFRRG
ncbi:hypothetical protein J6590_035514 [Homalodisca vitripennis]|nr:hypothetical protein J6590_035514 [Homalodisca vitripennis]